MPNFFSLKVSLKRVVQLFGIMMVGSALTVTSMIYLAHKYPPIAHTAHATSDDIRTFEEVLETLIENSVNEEGVADRKALIEIAIEAIYEHIGDKHGGYLDKEATKQFNDSTNPKGYSGAGMGILWRSGEQGSPKGVQITEIFDGSFVDDVGIIPGDIVTHVDGVQYDSMEEFVSHIKGDKGTTVKFRIMRGDVDLGEFDIQRVQAKVQTVFTKEHECFLILRVTQFANKTSGLIETKVAQSVKKECGDKFRGVVLDLRNNPGGLLSSAVNISEKWTTRGELIVRVQPKEGYEGRFIGNPSETICKEEDGAGICYYSAVVKFFQDEPLVILINGGSASASEIVTSSLVTNYPERVSTMGRKSFGKGSVQSFFDLSDGTLLKITTAKYYPAGTVTIDGVGIEPGLPVDQPVFDGDEGMQQVNYLLARSRMDPTYDLELAEAIKFLKLQEEHGSEMAKVLWVPVNKDVKYKCHLNKPCEELVVPTEE